MGGGTPRIAITIGDPGGIGPEVAYAALLDDSVRAACRPLVVGERALIDEAARCFGSDRLTGVDHVDLGLAGRDDFGAAAIDPRRGDASYRYLIRGFELVRDGVVDGLVTGPINKAAWHAAGHRYPGQTEVLASLCETQSYAMMLATGGVRSVLVTTHVPLQSVPSLVTAERVFRVILLASSGVSALVDHSPRLAVAGLNPHAGEEGLFGSEEQEVIAPAIERGRKQGIDVVGPLPADTVYIDANAGRFDAVIAMYHDQGLIPVKVLGFDRGINVTLGLTIVRTSPDHGTAFDISGKGLANPSSMVEAIIMATRLAQAQPTPKSAVDPAAEQ